MQEGLQVGNPLGKLSIAWLGSGDTAGQLREVGRGSEGETGRKAGIRSRVEHVTPRQN